MPKTSPVKVHTSLDAAHAAVEDADKEKVFAVERGDDTYYVVAKSGNDARIAASKYVGDDVRDLSPERTPLQRLRAKVKGMTEEEKAELLSALS